MPKVYRIQEFGRVGNSLLFTVGSSSVDDGKFPLRSFGPASFAACQEFVSLVVDDGLLEFRARYLALEGLAA